MVYVCLCILPHVNVTIHHVPDYLILMYLVSWFVDFGPSQNASFIKFPVKFREILLISSLFFPEKMKFSQNDNFTFRCTPPKICSRLYVATNLFEICRANSRHVLNYLYHCIDRLLVSICLGSYR